MWRLNLQHLGWLLVASLAAGSAEAAARSYDVFGRRYFVLDSAEGYRERGVASWYGGKFHGNLTANGEIYDMHALTAAHKTLPIPTDVEVTNLRNGKSVILRINDRGPFVDDRVIDVSYAAAQELGLVGPGTGLVEIRALSGVVATPDQLGRPNRNP